MKIKNKWSATIGILFLASVLFLGASGVQAKATRLEMELTITTVGPMGFEPGESWISGGVEHVRGRTFSWEIYGGIFVTSDGRTGTYNWGGFSYSPNWNQKLDTGETKAWGTWIIKELTITFDDSDETWSGSFEGTFTNKFNYEMYDAKTPGHGTGGDFEGMHYRGFRVGYFAGPVIQDTMIIFDPHGRIGT
ncbi:MAG: hypothetical protein ACFFCZ_20700 [Promethearchaeota archaeon]